MSTQVWKDGLSNEGGYDRYGNSPYYTSDEVLPEGWSLFDAVDVYDESYEFHLVAVWKDPDGKLYGAADSGCSCPTPFADLTPDGMKPIGELGDLDPLFKSLHIREDDEDFKKASVLTFKGKVHRHLLESTRR